jgi:hypothetical protein
VQVRACGGDRLRGAGEDPAGCLEPIEDTEGVEGLGVMGAKPGDVDGYAAPFEALDRVTQYEGARRVDCRHSRHPENDHLDVGDAGQFKQEPVRGGEEQWPVEPVGDDVLGQ